MKLLFTLLLTISALSILAHNTGTIKGKVTEAKNGDPIPGASIAIKESIIGIVADINGNFELKNMQLGTYELVCSSMGYKTIVEKVTVKDDETTVIQLVMEEAVTNLDEIIVEASKPNSTSSSLEVRKIDMQLRPFRTSQDMLMMVPGLITAQHAGGGKAEQIFLRGFDCDHGTDVAINVDGMPVNMVSHAHGQGYADLHFMIAETVDEMEVNKGPYSARFGDFATAGAISFKTKNILDSNLIKAEAGMFNTQKYTLMFQPSNGGVEQNGYIAAQYYHTDGAFKNAQDLQRMNVYAKYFIQLSHNSKITISAGGYNSGWNASGQIPQRAIDEGIVSRFGALDHLEGGTTDRENINLNYNFKNHNGDEFEVQSYLISYNFKLFSNFTYFAVDSVNGDMIEQTEHRTVTGLNSTYKFYRTVKNIRIKTTIGCGYRADNITEALWHSPNRNRMNVFTSDDVLERNFNIWAEQEYILNPKFRIIAGLRHDYFTFVKEDHVNQTTDTVNNGLPHGSGNAQKSVISPKLTFVYEPINKLAIYLNFGQGFHSNDARMVVENQITKNLISNWQQNGISQSQINTNLIKYNLMGMNANSATLPQATGGEIGIRTKLFNCLHIGIAGWYLYLEKEIVYSGDGGTAELSNATQRIGFDVEGRLAISSWLWLDADVCWAHGTILNEPTGQNFIPLAPTLTASGGISMLNKSGFSGSLRVRHIGDRPANEDDSVTALGYTLLNSSIGYQLNHIKFIVNLENILNVNWNEAQFDTKTRLKGEPIATNGLCFTPGNSRNIQVGISYRF